MSHWAARRPVAERLRRWLVARAMGLRVGDGSAIETVRTGDGRQIEQIRRGDGTVVWQRNEIPDSEDLHARYDATELSLSDGADVTQLDDQTSNGYDLTPGSAPSYVESGINGNPAVRFEAGEFLNTVFSTLSQPNHVFAVYRLRTVDLSTEQVLYDSEDSSERNLLTKDSTGNGTLTIFAGSNIRGGSGDTNAHIHSGLFNGASSVAHEDGAEIINGDAGGQGLNGLTLGARYDGGVTSFADIGELLIYPQDKSGIRTDVERYLSDKWGIVL